MKVLNYQKISIAGYHFIYFLNVLELCDEAASGVVTATRIADINAWPISWDTLKGLDFT